MVASGGLDGTVSLRVVSTGKFLHLVRPGSSVGAGSGYELRIVRLSFRGYIVAVLCSSDPLSDSGDILSVFTVNGDLIRSCRAEGKIYSLVISEDGFSMLAGGSASKLLLYDLLDLKTTEILMMQDGKIANFAQTLKEFIDNTNSITALELSPLEGCQQLLIGTNNGDVYSYRYSPRLIGQKISFQ